MTTSLLILFRRTWDIPFFSSPKSPSRHLTFTSSLNIPSETPTVIITHPYTVHSPQLNLKETFRSSTATTTTEPLQTPPLPSRPPSHPPPNPLKPMSFNPPLPHFTSRVSKRKKPNTSNVSKFQVDPLIFPSLPTTLERPVTPEIPMNGEEGGEFNEDKGGNFRSPTPLQPQFGRGTGSVFGGDGHDMSPVLNHMVRV